jgi:hypothetical protein
LTELIVVTSAERSLGFQQAIHHALPSTVLVSNGDTKGVTKSSGSSSLSNTAVGNWWSKLGTAAVRFYSFSSARGDMLTLYTRVQKVGICIGAAAVFLFTLVALCTCIARSKDNKKKKYAAIHGENNAAAIPLTAAGAAATKSNRLAPQASSASLASSVQKGRYDDPFSSPQQEYTQQQAWAMGQQRQQEQYYPQQQRYAPQHPTYPQQQHFAPQHYYAQPPLNQFGYHQQQGWQGQGRY